MFVYPRWSNWEVESAHVIKFIVLFWNIFFRVEARNVAVLHETLSNSSTIFLWMMFVFQRLYHDELQRKSMLDFLQFPVPHHAVVCCAGSFASVSYPLLSYVVCSWLVIVEPYFRSWDYVECRREVAEL